MSIQIRSAAPADAPALLAIYAPYVAHTAITFEYDVPAEAEFARRIAETLKRYPYLVAEEDGVPVGYAYAGKFHDRAAYDWSVETSIYVEQHRKRQGIGRQLHGALEQELQVLLDQVRALAENARGAAEDADALRAQEVMATAEAADGRAALSALAAGLEAASQRRETVEQELTAIRKKLESGEKESKENRRALNEAKEEAQAVQNVIQGHSLRMDARRKKAEAAAAEKLQLTMDVGKLDDRIRMLTEMEKEYEGFSKAVKTVMQAAEKNTLRGVHGPVASLMTTKKEYAVALEIALGAALQNIVVDREEDAKTAIRFLQQRDGGRATFLPLTAIRGDVLRENVAGEYGFVGVASELVRYDKQYDSIFKNLLGRTVVMEDMDSAIALARKFRNGFRIVTLDGQVINRGGSMAGGSVSRSAGVLSRANELERLSGQQGALHEKLRAATERAAELQRELQKAEYELQVAQEQQRKAEDDVLTLQGRQDHYDVLLESLRLSRETMEQELAALERQTLENNKKAAGVQETIDKAESRAAALRQQAQEKLSGQTDLNDATDRLDHQQKAGRSGSAER